jgi:hypothetical protein
MNCLRIKTKEVQRNEIVRMDADRGSKREVNSNDALRSRGRLCRHADHHTIEGKI